MVRLLALVLLFAMSSSAAAIVMIISPEQRFRDTVQNAPWQMNHAFLECRRAVRRRARVTIRARGGPNREATIHVTTSPRDAALRACVASHVREKLTPLRLREDIDEAVTFSLPVFRAPAPAHDTTELRARLVELEPALRGCFHRTEGHSTIRLTVDRTGITSQLSAARATRECAQHLLSQIQPRGFEASLDYRFALSPSGDSTLGPAQTPDASAMRRPRRPIRRPH